MALSLSNLALGFAPQMGLRAAAPAAAAASPVMGVESELGATGPLGYWDPLRLVRALPDHRQSACSLCLPRPRSR